MEFIKVFVVGGSICLIAQLLIDFTKLTPARILVIYVTAGAILSGLGIYQKIVDFGMAGARIPLTGFGHVLVKGVIKEVDETGLLGAFTGGIKAGATGITAAILFGYVVALVFSPKPKK